MSQNDMVWALRKSTLPGHFVAKNYQSNSRYPAKSHFACLATGNWPSGGSIHYVYSSTGDRHFSIRTVPEIFQNGRIPTEQWWGIFILFEVYESR